MATPVHTYLITVACKDEESLEAVMTKAQDLITHSNLERDTLSYEIVRPEEVTNPPSFMIVERYVTKDFLINVHMKSEVFGALMAWNATKKDEFEFTLIRNHLNEVQQSVDARSKALAKGDNNTQGDGFLVFGGSRPGTDAAFVERSKVMGKLIAGTGRPLVFGGGTRGIMGAAAEGCIEGKGKLIGVIPRPLVGKEAPELPNYEPIYCDTMGVRKSIMFSKSNTIVSLPGGIGTFDELLEVMTLYQLNCYRPKIGILNVNGFYEPFFAHLKSMIDAGFVNADVMDYMVVDGDPESLMKKLDEFERPASNVPLVWSVRP